MFEQMGAPPEQTPVSNPVYRVDIDFQEGSAEPHPLFAMSETHTEFPAITAALKTLRPRWQEPYGQRESRQRSCEMRSKCTLSEEAPPKGVPNHPPNTKRYYDAQDVPLAATSKGRGLSLSFGKHSKDTRATL